MAQPIHTTCPYCGVGCGVIATREAVASEQTDNKKGNSAGNTNSVITIIGDPDHPANAGKLCSKGMALAETFTHTDRLTDPMVNGETTSWDSATTHIAKTLANTIAQHGPESVAFYVSGQLLTEDYYVVNKFVKGWLGTANIDTNSRLCMASSVAGHKRAFGSDTVPGCYEDLDSAELIILVGSNLAWCHPVIYQRIMNTKAKRPDLMVVVIDPRRSITADNADLHLAIKPDGDTLLFNALLQELCRRNVIDHDYIRDHVSGYNDALAAAGSITQDDVARQLGLSIEELTRFFELVATREKTVTVYSQGVNQSQSGTDKVNAIINCHLATGRIGKPGMGPFSITGQPNAMGGREVGGLATMLACHRDLDNPAHQSQVQRFWNSPHIANKAGLTAVDMFKAVDSGAIKAIWIMATNPVDSLPEADSVASALAKCPLVIVSDVTSRSDTLPYAHVVLPAQAFGEKEGTVTNSERRISRQRRINEPLGQAKPDWWAMAQVAQKMGYQHAFAFQSPAQVFSEYAALSAFENYGQFDFDIGACASLSEAQYDALTPFQWPRVAGQNRFEHLPEKNKEHPIRFFANGHFYTPDKRGRMIPVIASHTGNGQLSDKFPLILNTGRIRDQWHTMTRTGYIPRLMGHRAEPFVELNPSDALIHGIEDADIVQINSPTGHTLARAMLSDRQVPGQLFAPMHWTGQFASNARIDTLIEAATDPVSRQPASKNQAVSIQRFAACAYAFMLTRSEPNFSVEHWVEHRDESSDKDKNQIEYWATSPIDRGWRTEVASTLSVNELTQQLLPCIQHASDPLAGHESDSLEQLTYHDGTTQRTAWFDDTGQLHAMLYLAPTTVETSRSWAAELFTTRFDTNTTRWRLMAGRPANDQPDKGAIVCSCFSVGDKQIANAVKTGTCLSTDAIGKQLSAGTNCGSCRNEIDIIVRRHTVDRQRIPQV